MLACCFVLCLFISLVLCQGGFESQYHELPFKSFKPRSGLVQSSPLGASIFSYNDYFKRTPTRHKEIQNHSYQANIIKTIKSNADTENYEKENSIKYQNDLNNADKYTKKSSKVVSETEEIKFSKSSNPSMPFKQLRANKNLVNNDLYNEYNSQKSFQETPSKTGAKLLQYQDQTRGVNTPIDASSEYQSCDDDENHILSHSELLHQQINPKDTKSVENNTPYTVGNANNRYAVNNEFETRDRVYQYKPSIKISGLTKPPEMIQNQRFYSKNTHQISVNYQQKKIIKNENGNQFDKTYKDSVGTKNKDLSTMARTVNKSSENKKKHNKQNSNHIRPHSYSHKYKDDYAPKKLHLTGEHNMIQKKDNIPEIHAKTTNYLPVPVGPDTIANNMAIGGFSSEVEQGELNLDNHIMHSQNNEFIMIDESQYNVENEVQQKETVPIESTTVKTIEQAFGNYLQYEEPESKSKDINNERQKFESDLRVQNKHVSVEATNTNFAGLGNNPNLLKVTNGYNQPTIVGLNDRDPAIIDTKYKKGIYKHDQQEKINKIDSYQDFMNFSLQPRTSYIYPWDHMGNKFIQTIGNGMFSDDSKNTSKNMIQSTETAKIDSIIQNNEKKSNEIMNVDDENDLKNKRRQYGKKETYTNLHSKGHKSKGLLHSITDTKAKYEKNIDIPIHKKAMKNLNIKIRNHHTNYRTELFETNNTSILKNDYKIKPATAHTQDSLNIISNHTASRSTERYHENKDSKSRKTQKDLPINKIVLNTMDKKRKQDKTPVFTGNKSVKSYVATLNKHTKNNLPKLPKKSFNFIGLKNDFIQSKKYQSRGSKKWHNRRNKYKSNPNVPGFRLKVNNTMKTRKLHNGGLKNKSIIDRSHIKLDNDIEHYTLKSIIDVVETDMDITTENIQKSIMWSEIAKMNPYVKIVETEQKHYEESDENNNILESVEGLDQKPSVKTLSQHYYYQTDLKTKLDIDKVRLQDKSKENVNYIESSEETTLASTTDRQSQYLYTTEDKICQMNDGTYGVCENLYQCIPILQESEKYSRANLEILSGGYCDYEGVIPQVCCPTSQTTAALLTTLNITEPNSPRFLTTTPSFSKDFSSTSSSSTISSSPVPDSEVRSVDLVEESSVLLRPPYCGITINGERAYGRDVRFGELGHFPWLALLGYQTPVDQVSWRCGGSLISAKHVLTSANCIVGQEKELYLVRLGEVDIAQAEVAATPQDLRTGALVAHEEYDAHTSANDIGIVVLAREIDFSPSVSPVCLPVEPSLQDMTFEKTIPVVAGWKGADFFNPPTTRLRAVQLPTITNKRCAAIYRRLRDPTLVDHGVLCAGFTKQRKASCQGDSGGPLVLPIQTKLFSAPFYYQIGIISHRRPCTEPAPAVFTRVTHYIPWIEEMIQELHAY